MSAVWLSTLTISPTSSCFKGGWREECKTYPLDCSAKLVASMHIKLFSGNQQLLLKMSRPKPQCFELFPQMEIMPPFPILPFPLLVGLGAITLTVSECSYS